MCTACQCIVSVSMCRPKWDGVRWSYGFYACSLVIFVALCDANNLTRVESVVYSSHMWHTYSHVQCWNILHVSVCQCIGSFRHTLPTIVGVWVQNTCCRYRIPSSCLCIGVSWAISNNDHDNFGCDYWQGEYFPNDWIVPLNFRSKKFGMECPCPANDWVDCVSANNFYFKSII